jgi:hypothetical protein
MNRHALLFTVAFLFASGLVTGAPAQTATVAVTKDSTAISLVSNALNAMTPMTVNDVTLTGQVLSDASGDGESGMLTFMALNGGDANLAYSLATGPRSEIINPASEPQAAWSGTDGVWHKTAIHNTWTPAAWFAPVLILESALTDPQLAIQNLGSASLNGQSVQHLRIWRVLTSTSGAPATLALIQSLSTVDLYLDAASKLPVALDFNLHPDSNAGTNIPVEIRYSNWQKSTGTLMPFHIQKFFNGELLDDISVSSAIVNSGLSSSSFNVPTTSGDAE